MKRNQLLAALHDLISKLFRGMWKKWEIWKNTCVGRCKNEEWNESEEVGGKVDSLVPY